MRSLRKDILDRLTSILDDETESLLFVQWSESNFVDESVKFLLAVMREKKRMAQEACAIFDRFCAEGAPLSLNPRDHRDLEDRKQLYASCQAPLFNMWDGVYYNIFRLVVDNDGLKCFKDWQKENAKKSGEKTSGGFLKLKFKKGGAKKKEPAALPEAAAPVVEEEPAPAETTANAEAKPVKEEIPALPDLLRDVFQVGDSGETGLNVNDLVLRSLQNSCAWRWLTYSLAAVPLSPIDIINTLFTIYQNTPKTQCLILESIRKWVGDNILNVALVPEFSQKIEELSNWIMVKEPEGPLLGIHRTNIRTIDQMVKNRKRKHEIHKASQYVPESDKSGIEFIDMNPVDVARQIGYIEEQMWFDLHPDSILQSLINKEEGVPIPRDSPVYIFADHLKALTEWALNELLSSKLDLETRATILEKLITVCDSCFEMRNLAGANAIGDALLSEATLSLKNVWAAIDQTTWNRVSGALVRENDFKSYRTLLARNPRGYTTIPWVTIHFHDLQELHQSTNPVTYSDGKINVKKLMILGKALNDLLIKKTYEITPKRKIHNYLTQNARVSPKKVVTPETRVEKALAIESGRLQPKPRAEKDKVEKKDSTLKGSKGKGDEKKGEEKKGEEKKGEEKKGEEKKGEEKKGEEKKGEEKKSGEKKKSSMASSSSGKKKQ
eukprot:TRINITY_DN674_c0_g1_i1.p1 TRINITY_DN674_c0_g1~~TRINITY_DN674_c0_g1_i1.p1  ORF type:complete len:666 (-),score=191.11 TRINITY_DN674_c0_g1_i1:71-2068(-)